MLHDGAEAGFFQRREENGGDPSQRIETYGIKERREAQANAFAREYLLPRPLAKKLFFAGERASDIAKRLGIALEKVLQQLADGILPPDLPLCPQEKTQGTSDAQNQTGRESRRAREGEDGE